MWNGRRQRPCCGVSSNQSRDDDELDHTKSNEIMELSSISVQFSMYEAEVTAMSKRASKPVCHWGDSLVYTNARELFCFLKGSFWSGIISIFTGYTCIHMKKGRSFSYPTHCSECGNSMPHADSGLARMISPTSSKRLSPETIPEGHNPGFKKLGSQFWPEITSL